MNKAPNYRNADRCYYCKYCEFTIDLDFITEVSTCSKYHYTFDNKEALAKICNDYVYFKETLADLSQPI